MKWIFRRRRLLLVVVSVRAQHDRLRNATRLAFLIWRVGTDQLYTGVVPGVGE
jgi:hypothetical protein